MLFNGIYERRTVSTTTTTISNAAVFTPVPVLPLMFTASNENTQEAATFYICSYNNEQLTGTFSETWNSNQNVPHCPFGGYVPLGSHLLISAAFVELCLRSFRNSVIGDDHWIGAWCDCYCSPGVLPPWCRLLVVRPLGI
jgi:hypothetical protein